MLASTLVLALAPALVAPQGPMKGQATKLVCIPTLKDAAGGACIHVSTIPTLGMLLPLGPQLFVDGAGQVGVGTLTPTTRLDVAGVVRSSDGGFKFPDGTVQTTAAVTPAPGPPPPPATTIGTVDLSGFGGVCGTVHGVYEVEVSVTNLGGPPAWSELRLTKDFDSCSTQLLSAHQGATSAAQVEVRVGDFKITLHTALITTYCVQSVPGLLPREEIALNFAKIGYEHDPAGGPTTTTEWDLVMNTGSGPDLEALAVPFVRPDLDPVASGVVEVYEGALTDPGLGQVEMVRPVDKSSPSLMLSCCKGVSLARAVLELRQYSPGAMTDVPYVQISLMASPRIVSVAFEMDPVLGLVERTLVEAGLVSLSHTPL